MMSVKQRRRHLISSTLPEDCAAILLFQHAHEIACGFLRFKLTRRKYMYIFDIF